MIGMIITGHGSFATGMASALELLVGHQDFLKCVDFKADHSEQQLKTNLTAAFESLKECGKIFVLCDILGGSPFKNAVTLSFGNERVRVLYGLNMAMAVELAMQCMMNQESADRMDEMASDLIEAGRNQIGSYQFQEVKEEEADEGI